LVLSIFTPWLWRSQNRQQLVQLRLNLRDALELNIQFPLRGLHLLAELADLAHVLQRVVHLMLQFLDRFGILQGIAHLLPEVGNPVNVVL
jgi:hypothetical protein